MSTFAVLHTYGLATLLRFLGALALFIALHLVRLPLVVAARVLEVAMFRVDAYLTDLTRHNTTAWADTPWFDEKEGNADVAA